MRKIQTWIFASFKYLHLETPKRRGRTLAKTNPTSRRQFSAPDIHAYGRRNQSCQRKFRHSTSPTLRTESFEPSISTISTATIANTSF